MRAKIIRLGLLAICATAWNGIPVLASSRVSWSVWASIPDILVGLIAPFVFSSWFLPRRHRPYTRGSPVVLFGILFLLLAALSTLLALTQANAPLAQWGYPAFTAYRFLQAAVVVAAFWRYSDDRHARLCIRLLVMSAVICAGACLLQNFGLLDYRILVAHLPSGNAGPWEFRLTILPDAALGTWNFNRINVAHFLVIGLLLIVLKGDLTVRSVLSAATILGGILCTQSRSVAICAFMAVLFSGILRGQIRYVAGVIVMVTILGIGYKVYQNSKAEGVIEVRAESVTENLEGRAEIQMAAYDWWKQAGLRPLLIGVGVGNTGYFVFNTGFMPAHGQWITLLVESGIIGTMFFAALVIAVLFRLPKKDPIQIAIASIFFGLVASSGFNDLLLPSPTFQNISLVYSVLIGITFVLRAPRAEFSRRMPAGHFRPDRTTALPVTRPVRGTRLMDRTPGAGHA